MKMTGTETGSRSRCVLLTAGTITAAGLMLGVPLFAYGAEVSAIDSSRTGSITIHKYDITSAESKGAYTAGMIQATGQADSTVESSLQGYEIEGVEFSYVKVGEVETFRKNDSSGTAVKPVFEISDGIAKILELPADHAVDMHNSAEPCGKEGVLHFTGEQVQEAMASILKNDNILAKNALEGYMDYAGSSACAMPKTDQNGLTSVSGLAQGLYLVVETEVPENVTDTTDPWLVQLPFTDTAGKQWVYDMDCYPKNQTGNPTLNKCVRSIDDMPSEQYVDTTTASEGDTLEYLLISKLPHISSSATHLTEYTFADTLSKGMNYNKDAVVYFYHTSEDAAVNRTEAADAVWEPTSGCYTAVFEDLGNQGTTMTIALTEKGLAEVNQKSDAYMVVAYKATMGSGADTILGDAGNPNDVQLTWRRTSEQHFNTLEDRSYVYTYGLKLTKSFSDGKGDFSKVKFNLYNSTDRRFVIGEQTGDGMYVVTGSTEESRKATIFTPNTTTGLLVISGMEGDAYKVSELETAGGYSLLSAPIALVIQPTAASITPAAITYEGKIPMQESTVQNASAQIDGADSEMADGHAFAVLSVINSSGFALPQTGGNGLYAVTVIGVVIAAAGFGLIGKKKKEEEA